VAIVALSFSSAHADLKVGATQAVAYEDLSNENPAPVTAAYELKTLILKTGGHRPPLQAASGPGDRISTGEGRSQAGLPAERMFNAEPR